MAVAGSEQIDDLGDAYAREEADAVATRSGVRPVLVGCAGLDDEVRFAVEQIGGLTAAGAIGLGDIAVSASTNHQVEELGRRLSGGGIPT